MSKKNKVSPLEETEVIQTARIPAQDPEVMGVGIATEIIADQKQEIEKMKEELRDMEENLGICSGLADRYLYRQRIIENVLKINNASWLRSVYVFTKTLLEG